MLTAVCGNLVANVIFAGKPLAGATIEIDELGRTADTMDDGSALIKSVLPGTYNISVTKIGFIKRNFKGIVIKAGEDYGINADMISATGTIIAYVMSQGQPLAGSTVSIPFLMISAVTDLTGKCNLPFIEPGTYPVQAAAPGRVTQTLTTTIGADAIVAMSFNLERMG
jgi:hypothetical protein